VAAVLSYLADRGSELLFLFQERKPLTRSHFVMEVKRVLDHLVVDSKCYFNHNFRSGAAAIALEWDLQNETAQS